MIIISGFIVASGLASVKVASRLHVLLLIGLDNPWV